MEANKQAKNFIGYKKGNIEVVGLGYRDKSGKRRYKVKCHLCGRTYYQTHSNLMRLMGLGCGDCRKIYLCRVDCPVKKERLHSIWQAMRKRCNCTNENDNHYKYYSGRGIKVCDEWNNSYQAFRKWAYENGWNEESKLTIDRIDNDGNYCPENCRFATHKEQSYNRRNTVYIKYEGKLYNYDELSSLLGMSKPALIGRIKRGTLKTS